jgi:hypothetical protein
MLKRFVLLIPLIGWSTWSQAGSITLTPSQSNLNVGDVFTLTIAGTGFTQGVIGGGLDLTFDPGLVLLGTTTIDPQWNFGTSPGDSTTAPGKISGMTFNLFPSSVTGDFKIATLTFSALKAGTTNFASMASSLFPFVDDTINVAVIDGIDFGSTQVTIADAAPVPVPAAAWLLLSGLATVGGIRRRRR